MDLDLAQLRALATTVRGGTLEAAARELHVTPSAISQRLRALEVATGRILLVRTKPVQVTESGQAVLRLARQVDLLTADVARELGGDEPSAAPVSSCRASAAANRWSSAVSRTTAARIWSPGRTSSVARTAGGKVNRRCPSTGTGISRGLSAPVRIT